MKKSEFGGIGRFFTNVLIFTLICGLAAAVLYLLSQINHSHYRLAALGDQLVIQRGVMLPVGFAPYVPETEALQKVYGAIPMPKGEAFPLGGEFDSLPDVDRALFGMLSGWARQRLESSDTATLELAEYYVKRLESLPAISEEQRLELRTLRANLAFRNGGRLVADVVNQLHRAQASYRLALELGTTHLSECQLALEDITRKLTVYEPVAAPAPSAPSK